MTEEQEVLLGKALAGDLSREEFFGHSALLEEHPAEGEGHLQDRRVAAVLRLLLESKEGRVPFEKSLAVLARSRSSKAVFMHTTRRRAETARRKRFAGLGAALLGAALLALVLIWGWPSGDRPTVLRMQGEVRASGPSGVFQPAWAGELLEPSAHLETGRPGTATLRYRDGARIEVTSGTELSTSIAGRTKHLDLTHGAIEADVAGPEPGPSVVLETPHLIAETREARFRLAVGPLASLVAVTQGSVHLSVPGDRAIELGPGRYSVVAPNAPLVSRQGSASFTGSIEAVVAGRPFEMPETGASPPEPLRNGSMTEGGATPLNWDQLRSEKGALRISRDTQTFRTGPASLRLQSVGGTAVGEAYQVVEASGGASVAFAGALKSAGRVKVAVTVRSFDSTWKELEDRPILEIQNDTDWTSWQGQLRLPARTSWYTVGLRLEGDGSGWLDEVSAVGGMTPK